MFEVHYITTRGKHYCKFFGCEQTLKLFLVSFRRDARIMSRGVHIGRVWKEGNRWNWFYDPSLTSRKVLKVAIKQWRMKNGELIDIADMSTPHIRACLDLLKRKGFIGYSDLSTYLGSEPSGEMAQELYFSELRRIKTHPCYDELEAELKRRLTVIC